MKETKPIPVYSVRSEGGVHTVYRDAAPLETPRNLPVTTPTADLADAIVAECRAQGAVADGKLDLRKMPMTQMTLTALDITAKQRKEIIDGILRYGDSELVCQRASEPVELVAEQNKVWQPYVEWALNKFGADLRTGSGIIPFEQRPEALAALRTHVETYDIFPLTGVSEAVGISGSLILGLALATGQSDPATVFMAAELDQLWQGRKWGDDPAVAGRQAGIRRDLDDCARWFTLV